MHCCCCCCCVSLALLLRLLSSAVHPLKLAVGREREEKRVDIKTKLRFVQFVRKKEKREKDDDDDGKCNSDRKGTNEERNAIYFPFPPFFFDFFSRLLAEMLGSLTTERERAWGMDWARYNQPLPRSKKMHSIKCWIWILHLDSLFVEILFKQKRCMHCGIINKIHLSSMRAHIGHQAEHFTWEVFAKKRNPFSAKQQCKRRERSRRATFLRSVLKHFFFLS